MGRRSSDYSAAGAQVVGVLAVTLLFLALMLLTACNAPQGPQGPPGPQGLTGIPTLVYTSPATAEECPAGGLEIKVATGYTVQVTTTSVVCNGSDGKDAAGVSVVQFCPGTTTYPSEFNEVGFCIGGNLYATYSANDGFSTLLPPGLYVSNAIGSRCNFEVKANCQVVSK